ncbi:hypothetical protein OAT83_05410 [Gammaproteobacteria bacterium]|nr:hypothetical protein [Gammaproteobacteria bacterium]
MDKIFICTNDSQLLGAKVAKSSILRYSSFAENQVEILEEKSFKEFHEIYNQLFLRNGQMIAFDPNDFQSFTLLRFHIPFLMNYQNKALVIDPDIFLVREGLEKIFESSKNSSISAIESIYDNFWDSSVMLLDCSRLKAWNLKNFITKIKIGEMDYQEILNLKFCGNQVSELESKWNQFDKILDSTILLHTTARISQPWRVGLKFNSYIKPILKIIPRKWIYKILGRPTDKGIEHPEAKVTNFFFNELEYALKNRHISMEYLRNAVKNNFIRKDIFEVLKK